MASIAAHLSSHTILDVTAPQLTKMQQLAVSIQRTAKIARVLTNGSANPLVTGSKKYAQILSNKIGLFADEIFGPNFRHRETSLARVNRLMEELP